jgi:hypothetical protein
MQNNFQIYHKVWWVRIIAKTPHFVIHVEFYSLSNIFYFIIFCYKQGKIYLFLWRLQFQDLNAQNFLVARGLLTFNSQYFKVNMEEMWAPRPNMQLEYHTLSTICKCLCNIFTATLHFGCRSYFCNLSRNNDIVTRTILSWKIFNI